MASPGSPNCKLTCEPASESSFLKCTQHLEVDRINVWKKTTLICVASLLFALLLATPVYAGGLHHPNTKQQKKMVAVIRSVAVKQGLPRADADALVTLAGRESDWNPREVTGSCKGLLQLMTHDRNWANPYWNVRVAIKEIKHRYGTPRRALAHSLSHNWY